MIVDEYKREGPKKQIEHTQEDCREDAQIQAHGFKYQKLEGPSDREQKRLWYALVGLLHWRFEFIIASLLSKLLSFLP